MKTQPVFSLSLYKLKTGPEYLKDANERDTSSQQLEFQISQ